ncbi:universal stress protein [Wenjunlia vitaminophila]|uniref:Universal stress protein n=1 Tax=Wenjunlia vitaminophila TaxID=76728 RepID=A0A0T6LWC9_WENVI|nr:universal stress protein [Wenjunlia vitaminophila]KRV50455.1 universal stress protein [Wenjunlia vitaminophila]
MARPITAGVDGSPESLAAADWAAREARRRGLPLRLVYAQTWRAEEVPAEYERARRHPLEDTADEMRTLHPDLPITTERLTDQPEAVLPREAEDAEMLVLGSRGLGRFTGFLVGSVGMQVLARARAPVVMVRTGERVAAEQTRGEVVVGAQDLDESGEPVLGWAFAAADLRGATLRAVRTWAVPPIFGYDPAALRITEQSDALDARERELLSQGLRPWRERYPRVAVIEQTELGDPAETLVRAASRADLLVVGRRMRRSPLGIRVGPVTHGVLHHAPCPVAVIPHE